MTSHEIPGNQSATQKKKKKGAGFLADKMRPRRLVVGQSGYGACRCPDNSNQLHDGEVALQTRRVGQIVSQRWSLPLCSSDSFGLYDTRATSTSQPCSFMFTRSPPEAIPASKTWLRRTSPLLLSFGSDFPLKRGRLRNDCRSNNLRAASCLVITDSERNLSVSIHNPVDG
jgi:hypothetical protein